MNGFWILALFNNYAIIRLSVLFSGLRACLDWLESLPTWNKYINPVPYGAIGLNQSQISEVQSAVMKVHIHTLSCQ